MKMAGLCWISVLLAVSLSIENCEPSMNLDYVTRIAQLIQTNYPYHGMFSMAITIPGDPNEAFDNIDHVLMNEALKNGDVYIGRNAVVAVRQKKESESGIHYTDHAEAQVLEHVSELDPEGNILILYSWFSPCGDKCTNRVNRENILQKIEKNVRGTWETYAFVFNTVFTRTTGGLQIEEEQIKDTFHYLREEIVDDNIFRCYNTNENVLRCVKCFEDPADRDADPVDACVKN